ncbi:hypothetical protein ACTIVE_5530 [Actinomadura verrucosospora]|uniref:Uncharacterized protein n=1 Tax=Actinomadura verrucosospora TaxID=46165 RepID=A0A7D4A8G5_ACTVE|nr:hypothetical protein ACTIVE_5530 [Actinomadura verrucosospora]
MYSSSLTRNLISRSRRRPSPSCERRCSLRDALTCSSSVAPPPITSITTAPGRPAPGAHVMDPPRVHCVSRHGPTLQPLSRVVGDSVGRCYVQSESVYPCRAVSLSIRQFRSSIDRSHAIELRVQRVSATLTIVEISSAVDRSSTAGSSGEPIQVSRQ